jgi:hypothetical protein
MLTECAREQLQVGVRCLRLDELRLRLLALWRQRGTRRRGLRLRLRLAERAQRTFVRCLRCLDRRGRGVLS